MHIPKWLTVYGDRSYRGKCPREIEDQMSFFTWLGNELPEYRALTFHPKIESRRSHAQAAIDRKAGTLTKGVADVIAIGFPCLVMELKRKDESDSGWSDGQLKFLERAKNAGASVCVAFGLEAAKEAYLEWVSMQQSTGGNHDL